MRWLVLLLFSLLPGVALWRLDSLVTWIVLAIVNVAAFIANWSDKNAAANRGARVPEAFLHLLELAGGWPAAFVAQQTLRHKTAKSSYLFVFWLIVLVHEIVAVDFLLQHRLATTVWQWLAG